MTYNKLSADCDKELFDRVKKASKLEQRTISNFIRLACDEKAKEVLKNATN